MIANRRTSSRLAVVLVIVLWGMLGMAGAAWAATSTPLASQCIRVYSQGRSHDSQRFWGWFQNVCGSTVSPVVFDVLVFFCNNQSPPGSACGEQVVLRADLVTSFAPYEKKRIEHPFPVSSMKCGAYFQWDINLKVSGCTDHGDCWSKAQGLPATWGDIVAFNTPGCFTPECVAGQTKPCLSGCGQVICGPDQTWDGGGCQASNRCGGCGPEPACCAGELQSCASGCGKMACDGAGQWNQAGCLPTDQCGPCAGGTPTCAVGCTEPVCTDQGWVCRPKAEPSCGGCKQAVCTDGEYLCMPLPLPDCGPCARPLCTDGGWQCLPSAASGADDVACANPVPASELPPGPTVAPTSGVAMAPPPFEPMIAGSGCAVGEPATDTGPALPPALVLLGLALGRRRRDVVKIMEYLATGNRIRGLDDEDPQDAPRA